MSAPMKSKIFFLIGLIQIQAVWASQACDVPQEELRRISLPVDYANKGNRFESLARVVIHNPDAPYLLVIPGGPGGKIMNSDLSRLPTQFNLLLVDPRTIGCNANNPPDAFNALSTDTLALDLREVLEQLDIKKFIIYGQSYGTQVATVLADRLNSTSRQPISVVLEGTVGNSDSFLPGYNNALKHLMARIPKLAADTIQSISPSNDLLGFDSKTWAEFFLQMLPMGAAFLNMEPFLDKYLSEAFAEYPNQRSIDTLKYLLADIKKDSGTSNPTDPFFLKITCAESYEVIPSDFEMRNGEISVPANSTNKCTGYSLTEHYDPAKYKIHVPIWYLQGSEDPNTPIEGAIYHFKSQAPSERTFIEFIGGGHAVTAIDRQCTEAIWQLIVTDKETDKLATFCKVPLQVLRKSADSSIK